MLDKLIVGGTKIFWNSLPMVSLVLLNAMDEIF